MNKETYYGVEIDYSRDKLFDKLGLQRLKESYMKDDETSPQQRFAHVSKAFSSNPEHAQRLYEYSSKHWLSYSTPILSFGKSKTGMPISCFGGGTLVLTRSGFKNIEDIAEGDEVLTHMGEFQVVESTRESVSTDLYRLEVFGESFLVTGNHLIMTEEDGWVRVDQLDSSAHTISRIADDPLE